MADRVRIVIEGEWKFSNGWWTLVVPEDDDWYSAEVEVPERAITELHVNGTLVHIERDD